MKYLKQYLKTISDRGNIKLAESISKTAEDVGNQYIKTFSFSSHEIGLLLAMCSQEKLDRCLESCAKRLIWDSLFCVADNRQCCTATTNS